MYSKVPAIEQFLISFLIDWLLFSEKIEKKLSCILCEFPGEKANLYCQSLSAVRLEKIFSIWM